MSKCKFCGKPVICTTVWHTACAEKAIDDIVSDFCDNYCRYPNEISDHDELLEVCNKCRPVNRLFEFIE